MRQLFLVLCLLLISLVAHAQQAVVPEFERNLNQAEITVAGPNGQAPMALGVQPLPWRWDTHFPRQRGNAQFTLSFSLTASELKRVQKNGEGLGLLATQMGNRYRWKFNDGDWHAVGWSELQTQYRSKPRWHILPHEVLQTGTNTLVLELRMDPANDAGLSAIELKSFQASNEDYQNALNIRRSSALLVSFSSFVIGLFSLVMWRITKERLFALTCLAELAFATRQLAFFIDYPPVPTWFWNAVIASLFALYVGWVGQISAELIGVPSRLMDRVVLLYLCLSVPVLMAGYALGEYRVYRFWLVVMIALTVVLVARLTWFTIKTKNLNLWLYAVAAWVAMLFGFYDFLMLQTNTAGLGKVRLSTYAPIFLNLSLTFILIRKFVDDKQALYEAQSNAKAEREHATLLERQRIMSDIHDTIGSQLVGVLGMIRSGASYEKLERETSLALEELRCAIDAIQPVNGNLAAVLATLRLRLESRMVAHGLTIVWHLDELPRMVNMTPQVVQHVQRIVLEVLTNVIKHAKATTVTLSARATQASQGVLVEISDDGVGFPNAQSVVPHHGHGLRNIQMRAEQIGAKVSFKNATPQGACVALEFSQS